MSKRKQTAVDEMRVGGGGGGGGAKGLFLGPPLFYQYIFLVT